MLHSWLKFFSLFLLCFCPLALLLSAEFYIPKKLHQVVLKKIGEIETIFENNVPL